MQVVAKNARETQKVAYMLAKKLFGHTRASATVTALKGELGSGKTTFVQGFARALGVKENVLSPTFVLMKVYPLKRFKRFKHLVHIDCYRLDSPKDLVHLGFKDLLKDKDAIVLIEWADKIKKLIPRGAIWLKFRHGRSVATRIISLRRGKEI